MSDGIKSVYEIFLKKFKNYTKIQERALPIIEKGHNCVIIAPTGAGKTEAAMLPVIDMIAKQEGQSGIIALYITPLKALNRDTIKRLEQFCAEVGVSISVRHGDTSIEERARQSRRAPMILITTPETFQSILPTKGLRPALKNVKAVVVDEIHELYYNKRGAQLSIGLERLEEIAPNFQRIGISATIGDTEMVKRFLCGKRECKEASVDENKRMMLSVEVPKEPDKRLSEMAEKFGLDQEALARLNAIAFHIKESKSTLIFANTRQVVEALGSRLLYINSIENFGGIGVHHSSISTEERVKMEDSFKTGTLKSLIATSSLELGIDVGNVDLVVQYGSPRQALRLVQRVGRSGHTEKGVAKGIIIAANMVEAIESVAVCSNVNSGKLEKFNMQSGALDVLANQICGIALDKWNTNIDEIYTIVKRSYLYKDLEPKKLTEMLNFMAEHSMIGFDDFAVLSGPTTRMYYYSHLSVIPDVRRFKVKNIIGNKIISSLDEGFVVTSLEENAVFITKGLPWKVVSIDEDTVSVEPSTDLEAAVPDWSGESMPVSYDVSKEVFELLNNEQKMASLGYLGKEYLQGIREALEKQRGFFMPSAKKTIIEQGEDYKIVYTGLGTLAGEGFARLLAHSIMQRTGKAVNMRSSPYMIFLELPRKLDLSHQIKLVSQGNLELHLKEALKDSELFRYKLITVAKLFGIVERGAALSKHLAKKLQATLTGTPVYEETMRELMHNYFDVNTLRKFLGEISSNKVKVEIIDAVSLTPLSKLILESAYRTKELIMPLIPSAEVINSFSSHLLSKSMKMICTYCGFNFTRRLSELKDAKVNCPSCNSPLIAPYRDEYVEIVKKRKEGKKLTRSEQETLKEMLRQASLFDSYGGKAAIALSTYGVGPRNAARVLMMLRPDEKLFYLDLIEAQKNFIKNKKYWAH